MSAPQTEPLMPNGAPPRARFRLAHLGIWLPLCLVHGTAMAWLAFGLQKYSAPLGLFPILLGLVLGVTLAGLMRLVHVAGRSTVVLGAIVATAAAISAQHYFSYLEQRTFAERQAAQFRLAASAHPDLVRGTPPKPASGVFEYLKWQAIRGRPIVGKTVARGMWAWGSWALDGCLTMLVALLVIVPASRQPYCDRCRTWFSTVRRGTIPATRAEELAAAFGLEAPQGQRGGTYRIVHCQGGCGPAGLEICWELPGGEAKARRLWVPPDDRSRLEELIHRGSATPPDGRPGH